MIRFVFSASMIIIGSFLEILYYEHRFHNDGISVWLSIVIGVGLTLLLSMAVHQRREKWAIWVIIPVAAYSVFATSAGQAFSLNVVLQSDAQSSVQSRYALDEMEDIQRQISAIDAEIESIDIQISGTVSTLEDRGWWRTTLAAAEERKDELRTRRDALSERMRELRPQVTEHTEVESISTNIYQFYGDMLGWSEQWLQFGLQTALSVFIALMAPIGIMTLPAFRLPWNRSKEIIRDHPSESGTVTWSREAVQRWVHMSWVALRNGKLNGRIIQRATFEKLIRERQERFDMAAYDDIYNLAKSSGVLDQNDIIMIENEREAVDKIIAERMRQ